ncbi:hypothetical protein AHAS_Ahas05G0117600 [Arachis hypogaea]
MRTLELETLNALEFSEYANANPSIVAYDKFVIGMKFSSKEIVIANIKNFTICKGIDYQIYEFEPTTFYAKYI